MGSDTTAVSIPIPFQSLNKPKTRGDKEDSDTLHYPSTPRKLIAFLKSNRTKALSFDGVSGSRWRGEHLLDLRVIAEKEEYWGIIGADAWKSASDLVKRNQSLDEAMRAFTADEIHLPGDQQRRILRDKGVEFASAFYASLRDILEVQDLPPSILEEGAELEVPRVLRNRPNPPVNYRESIISTENPSVHSDYIPSAINPLDSTVDLDEQRAQLKDELLTTVTGYQFIKTILEEHRLKGDQNKPYNEATIAQRRYKVLSAKGAYNCWTDGAVHVKKYYPEYKRSYLCLGKDTETVVDMEAKADGKTILLAQHFAELMAQMERRIRGLYTDGVPRVPSYDKLSPEDRKVYLLCFNQSDFRVVWADFSPKWLEWVFGPVEGGVLDPNASVGSISSRGISKDGKGMVLLKQPLSQLRTT